ncbi:hypothetical protein B7759_01844 [Burkholderia glumae]|nr:hypothetical protein KS03_2306 [Burkholderia glumae LMG 2196 = ATCC 33617]QKM54887.1 hypothetical protein CG017_02928 [Burkholderia glumae]QTP33261.1 hypothetical protein B7759_01844 [Burkholderia glumae]
MVAGRADRLVGSDLPDRARLLIRASRATRGTSLRRCAAFFVIPTPVQRVPASNPPRRLSARRSASGLWFGIAAAGSAVRAPARRACRPGSSLPMVPWPARRRPPAAQQPLRLARHAQPAAPQGGRSVRLVACASPEAGVRRDRADRIDTRANAAERLGAGCRACAGQPMHRADCYGRTGNPCWTRKADTTGSQMPVPRANSRCPLSPNGGSSR